MMTTQTPLTLAGLRDPSLRCSIDVQPQSLTVEITGKDGAPLILFPGLYGATVMALRFRQDAPLSQALAAA